jgi:CheY-like chemotaxis protein
MSKGRVFIADNVASQIVPLKEFLENHGYEVVTAGSLGEAMAVLNDSWVHLAIVDLRLENDEDERDISGLTLCKETDPVIPKIILTNYPTYEAVREALGPRLEGLPPAVDFLSKTDGLSALRAAVERAFTDHVRINPELEIEFGGTSFLAIISLMESAPKDGTRLLLWADELADLFRKLFRDCVKISIFPLPYRGQGDAVVVEVKPTGLSGPQRHVVVKCGVREVVQKEAKNYDTFVTKVIGDWSTQMVGFCEALRFGGATFSIVGGSLEDTERFSDFYRSTLDLQLITRSLDNLFNKTCRRWLLEGARRRSTDSLATLYLEQLFLSKTGPEKDLVAAVSSIAGKALDVGLRDIRRGKQEIAFQFSDGPSLSFPDPVSYTFGPYDVLKARVPCCVTHGDMNGNNVLVDPDGNTWLIDFERTGWGPVLRDFAELEAVIRWELVRERNLAHIYEFEKALIEPSDLHASLEARPQHSPDLAKAVKVAMKLRRIAANVPGNDVRHYYAGLLFYAIRMIISGGITSPGQARPSLIRRVHALLSAAMTCYRLEHWGDKWEGWPDEQMRTPIG